MWLEGCKMCSTLKVPNGRPRFRFDSLLSEFGFLRTHQSHLVNLKFVKEYIKVDGGYIVMKDGEPVPVSGRKKSQVVEVLSNL